MTPKSIPHPEPAVAVITKPQFPQPNSQIAATDRIHSDRISVIDVRRGFSLAGTVVAYCGNHYLAGPTPPSAGTLNLFLPLDAVVGD